MFVIPQIRDRIGVYRQSASVSADGAEGKGRLLLELLLEEPEEKTSRAEVEARPKQDRGSEQERRIPERQPPSNRQPRVHASPASR
jgi:hypothetical protein